MHSGDITIENISKIEGSAGLKVTIQDGQVTDLKFIIQDYRRFYTQVVKSKPIAGVPAFLSRICGTCSVSHLFASLEAIEKSQDIKISEQTRILRRLAYDALMIRDHALHLYFFMLPDVLGIDSILDIPDDPNDFGHTLLHDSFDIKKLGTDISNTIIGAAIHAPFPTIGGFVKNPDPSKFAEFIDRLEKIRPQVIRGIKLFYDWKAELFRNSDYLCLRNNDHFDFLEGEVINSDGKRVAEEDFYKFLKAVVIPYSQAEGYVFSDTHEDYLVGSLARLNLNLDLLHPRTKADISQYLNFFPSNNVYDNNLAQAVEILQAVDDAIDILKNVKINPEEKPVTKPVKAGIGVGVVEAPRGILYHMAEVDDKGMIKDYDVIVPTSQNQINIENDLKKFFQENLDKEEATLKLEAEKIIRTYDPCMSCATNFLKLEIIRK
ncbi:Ni/Fe hydrogenase subunit alpha [Candidatus Beckwithbacteria bacterium]|nr:Ni/Fe hydrogenase subunit alpha [Candidatus Beckwithbacteria bacterium]